VAQAENLDVIFAAMRGLRVFQPTGFKLPKQIDEELPIGEDGHTRAPDHTRDRMGEFPSVAFWNWSQPSTDWFNLATGEALADYNPSPVMRELVLGIESQSADPQYLAQHALNAELLDSGELVDAQGLAGPDVAKFVVSDGLNPPKIIDGPYPESKELLAGYRLVDVDSLDLAELSQIVEDEYGVSFKSSDVEQLKTVGDAVDFIVARA